MQDKQNIKVTQDIENVSSKDIQNIEDIQDVLHKDVHGVPYKDIPYKYIRDI